MTLTLTRPEQPAAHPVSTGGWEPRSPCTPADCLTTRPDPAPLGVRAVRWAGLFALLLAAAALPGATRYWLRLATRLLGVSVTLTGRIGPGELIVPNHISWLDVVILLGVTDARPLAKEEVRGWPVIGRMGRRVGVLFIDRDRIRSLPDTVAELTWALRDGGSMLVFPEGTTWCGTAMGTFRRAPFQAAVDAGAPVRPVAFRYGASAAAFVGEDNLLASIRRVIATRATAVDIRVLPALRHGTRRDLAWAAEAAVRAATADHQLIPS